MATPSRGGDVKAALGFALLCALLVCPSATAVAPAPEFEYVVVVVFENKESASVSAVLPAARVDARVASTKRGKDAGSARAG